jgi:hypothetical protein
MPRVAQIGLGVAGGVGAVLWLLGRRLAKPLCALVGMGAGGLAAVAIGRPVGAMTALWGLGGAVAGLALAWGLFRLWMGLSLALILSGACAAGALAWHGTPPPEVVEAPDAESQFIDFEHHEKPAERASFGEAVRGVADEQAQIVRDWWNGLSDAQRRLASGAAGIAAVVGVVLGLIRPLMAASIQTALAGSALLMLAGIGFLRLYAPSTAAWLPSSPRAIVVTLGLITALGILFQWTATARKTDK